MVEFIQGTPRQQIHLFSECIEELIGEEHVIRFIDAWVESLDIASLGFEIPKRETGRRPYRPQMLIKLYLYGYLERVRSSRRLEKECRRNTELVWLTENLAPDFKTIADFRKDSGQAIRAVFQEFLRFAMQLGLVKFRELAADSTKLRAQNSGKEVYRKDTIEEVERRIREKIEEYLKDIECHDETEEQKGLDVNPTHVKEALKELERLQKRERKIAAIKSRFQENPELREQYATDPDCRLQNDKGKIRPGYNVQAVVDGERKLIVACDVDCSQSDQNQIPLVVDRIREQKRLLGIEEKSSISTDSGYYSEKHLLEVLEE